MDDKVKLPQEDRDCYQSEFENAGAGLIQVREAFNDWCAILTTHSIQAAYAIIAANWAVHGTAQAVLSNLWSKLSLATVLIFLGLNLFATQWMIKLHYKQHLYANTDPDRWNKDFEKSKTMQAAWPYTEQIQSIGVWLRKLKVWAPVLATVLFIISLF